MPGVGAITVRIRPQVINLLVGDEAPSYSFDLAGRLIGAFAGGVNYRRGLDNRVLSKWRGADGVRQRRWLEPEEARQFLVEAYDLAHRVATVTDAPGLAVLQRWDWAALQADARRFGEIYRPVSILPPDQYLALVVQATEGCSYNQCTFCDFYRDRPFRVKSADELRAHIAAVRAFFGPAIGLRKSLFLADANALVVPMPRLRAWLDVIAEARLLSVDAGIFSFLDAFDVQRKTADEWAELAARGLRRVYIGMETGDDGLLRWLRKPGMAADVTRRGQPPERRRHRGQRDHHDRRRRRALCRGACLWYNCCAERHAARRRRSRLFLAVCGSTRFRVWQSGRNRAHPAVVRHRNRRPGSGHPGSAATARPVASAAVLAV